MTRTEVFHGTHDSFVAAEPSLLKRGRLYVADYAHDNWCRTITDGDACTCNPDVTVYEVDDSDLRAAAATPSVAPWARGGAPDGR